MNQRPRGLTLPGALVALLLAAHLCAAAAPAQEAADGRAKQVDALFAELEGAGAPGVAVAVVRDGKVVLRRGYGLASVEHRIPVTPSTVFDVASVSKQFTGLAVAMLVSEGKIKLADDVRAHIPELPDFGHRVTVDHLVHHTSGVRDWPGALLVGGWRFDDAITFNQIMLMAYNQRDLMFTPGAEYSYSNTNYNLLAELIRRVTGRPFRAWTDERLFRPLGMTGTRFRDHYTEVIADRAYGYARGSDGKYHHLPNNLTALGSSSLFSTVDDLARWLINFDDGKVGGSAAVSLMRTRGTLADGKANDYAFGLVHGDHRGLPMIYHDGGWAGFSSLVVYFPEQKFGVAALSNGAPVNVGDAVKKITDIYLEKELAARPAPAATPPPVDGPAVALPAAMLGGYVGLYRLGPGSYVRIRLDGAALVSEVTREKPAALTPRSEREFSAGREKIVFRRDASGKVEALEYRGRSAPRVDEPPSPQPSQLDEYVGDYESEELGTSYRVAAKAGALELQHRRHGTIPLARHWRDDFGSSVGFMNSVEFQRDGAGRVTGFVVNGNPRSRDIRFLRRR